MAWPVWTRPCRASSGCAGRCTCRRSCPDLCSHRTCRYEQRLAFAWYSGCGGSSDRRIRRSARRMPGRFAYDLHVLGVMAAVGSRSTSSWRELRSGNAVVFGQPPCGNLVPLQQALVAACRAGPGRGHAAAAMAPERDVDLQRPGSAAPLGDWSKMRWASNGRNSCRRPRMVATDDQVRAAVVPP